MRTLTTSASSERGPSRGPKAGARRRPTVSFVVTALNEGERVARTAGTVGRAAEGLLEDWEIILVDDGSTDDTARVVDRLAAENPRVRPLHNPRNLGLGGAYKRGVAAARMEYVAWVPGDDVETEQGLRGILREVGTADIVIPYLAEQRGRPAFRRIASRSFVRLVNRLFGLRVRYYTGPVVHRLRLLERVTIRTDSFAYQVEALVKLLRAGHSYVEVGYESARYDAASSALRPRNLLAVNLTVARLLWWAHVGAGRRRGR